MTRIRVPFATQNGAGQRDDRANRTGGTAGCLRGPCPQRDGTATAVFELRQRLTVTEDVLLDRVTTTVTLIN